LGRLLLSSAVERAERNFRFEEGGRVSAEVTSLVAGAVEDGGRIEVPGSTAFSNTGGWFAPSGGGVSTGVFSGIGAAAFKLSFAFLCVDHRLCMDLFKVFEPCLIHCGYNLFIDFKM
jgi:hypothetical protein